MFGKPRFRNNGPSAIDLSSKVSVNIDRESKQKPRTEDDDISGWSSAQNIISIKRENSQLLKRPISSQQKMSSQQKRDLKRTTSLIPRVAPLRPKTPTGESTKTARKSETSLKSKDAFVSDTSTSKSKKCVSIKSNQTGLTTPRDHTVVLEKMKKPESQRSNGSTRRESEQSSMDHIKTKQGLKTFRKAGDGRNGEKPEGRSTPRTTPGSSVDGNVLTKNLEGQYTAKKTVYGLMLRDFREKQKAIREHYRTLEDLRKKIQMQTGKEIQPEEMIKIQEIGIPGTASTETPTTNPELTCKRTIITFETKIFNDINVDFSEFQKSIQSELSEIHEMWLNLISTIINNQKNLKKNSEENNSIFEEREFLSMIEKVKYHAKVKIDNLMDTIQKLYENREKLKEELKTVMDKEILANIISKEYKDITARFKVVDEELIKEKIRTEDLMEKRNSLEEANRVCFEKIQKLEQTIMDQQDQMEQLSFQCKNLKKKEALASRGMSTVTAKDLKAKSELLKALENHITELTNDFNSEKKDFQTRIEQLEQGIKEKEEALMSETEMRKSLELSLAEAEEKIKNVREKKKAFTDMVDKTKQIMQVTSLGSTKRDEQLWKELEATKIVIKGYQEQINKMSQEKNKLLLKFQTISEDKSNKNSERLAAEIVRKDEIINGLKEQVTQLQDACEEHNAKYNKLLAQVKEVHEKVDGKTDIATLSKQLGEVKMQKKELQEMVKDLVTHNEELETALVQRSLELDQRDRLVKQQCNLLKMRDELADLVKSKDDAQYQGMKKAMEQSTKWEKKAEKIFKDLERKANELDDMYKTLVEKQKQVERLTKLVKIMEDQQDRAQEQRVRFETKINDLQRQLIEGKLKTQKLSISGN